MFLDEFVEELGLARPSRPRPGSRAEQLYDKVFYEYGDDSVAQLGRVHWPASRRRTSSPRSSSGVG
ncbi:MAG: hypothetical protein R2715_10010 [Ilumatobacteraceae bacterium]